MMGSMVVPLDRVRAIHKEFRRYIYRSMMLWWTLPQEIFLPVGRLPGADRESIIQARSPNSR
jgi:hypothetical protein